MNRRSTLFLIIYSYLIDWWLVCFMVDRGWIHAKNKRYLVFLESFHLRLFKLEVNENLSWYNSVKSTVVWNKFLLMNKIQYSSSSSEFRIFRLFSLRGVIISMLIMKLTWNYFYLSPQKILFRNFRLLIRFS